MDASLKRSMSAVGAHQVKSGREQKALNQSRQMAAEIDEKAVRERKKARIEDPFTYTVCVGMKPSNAHYYLHDDEEVVRLLSALGTSSQRMAQTRAADNKALNNPAGSPIAGGKSIGPASVATGRGGGSGVFSLRPADIPTSPPVPTSSLQANYAMQQSTMALKRNASLASRPQQKPASDSESEEDQDLDEEEAEFLRQKAASKGQGFGGIRKAL
jgi:hypothetical protein